MSFVEWACRPLRKTPPPSRRSKRMQQRRPWLQPWLFSYFGSYEPVPQAQARPVWKPPRPDYPGPVEQLDPSRLPSHSPAPSNAPRHKGFFN